MLPDFSSDHKRVKKVYILLLFSSIKHQTNSHIIVEYEAQALLAMTSDHGALYQLPHQLGQIVSAYHLLGKSVHRPVSANQFVDIV